MTELLIRGVGAPIGVAVILLAMLTQPWRRTEFKPRQWAAGVAVAAAFSTGYLALFGWPGVPPAESWQWLLLLVMPIAIISALLAALSLRWLWRLPIMVGVSVISAWLVFPEYVKENRLLWVAVIAAFVLAGWSAICVGSRRQHSGLGVTIMMIMTTCASLLLARHAGNAKLGQLAGAVAAPLGVCLVVAIWRKQAISAVTLAAPVALTHIGLVASAYFNHYSQTPNVAFGLIAAAPLGFFVSIIPGFGKLKPVSRGLLVLAVCLVLPAIGLLLAENAYSGDSYDY